MSAHRLDILPALPGSGLEPEEAPAKRVQYLPTTIDLAPELPEVESRQNRPALHFPDKRTIAERAFPVTSELTAGEVADLLRKRCSNCAHFRNDLWIFTKRVWERAPIGNSRREGIQKMVSQYAHSMCDSVPSMNDLARAAWAMESWGICGALTERNRDLVVVHPDACCPEGIEYYQDRDRAAKREASAVFDTILRKAQGRES
ncbi:MAG TPA: hypothetical protein VLY82_02750 [Nitrososphaerales archaeon]|nr:hypothetical protein [Nitrososphaerales archaeon]